MTPSMEAPPLRPTTPMSWFHHGLGRAKFTTLTTKLLVVLPPQIGSVTVSVMVAEPTWPGEPGAGVIVKVRWLPLPPKTRFWLGTREGLLETALNAANLAAVPVRVRRAAPVGVPTLVVRSGMDAVGACTRSRSSNSAALPPMGWLQ